MRRKEIWKKRLYKAAALGMALSMLAGSPMAALAEGEISANEAEAGEDQSKVIEVIGGFNDPSEIGGLILIDDDDDDDDDVILGSFPVTVEEETIVETEVDDDGVIIATETTITRTETAYKTDAEQEGEFDYTTKEAVEGQTLDYTDTLHFEEAETHYYVADENGEIVTVTNENGEEVKLEIEEGAIAEAEEVWVGEGENGEIIELDADKAEEVVYGTIGEDGSFIELEEGAEGGQYYAPSEEGMVVAAIWYTAEDANGNTVTIDPEVMKALRGEESEYTVNRAYFLDGQEYTAEELADILPEGAEIGALDYDLDSNVFVEGTEITFPAGTKLQGAPAAIAGITQFIYNGYVYNTRATIPTRTPAEGGWEFAEDVVIKASDLQIIGKARYTDREGEKNFTATENRKNVIVTVYDNEGNEIWSGNKATYDKIQEHVVSVVAGKIAVEDINGETIYLDPGTYKEVRESTKYVTEYRDEYYTPHDKYSEKELTTTLNGKEYKLTVQFWDNNRIGLRNAILFPAFESDHMLLQLGYNYAEYCSFGHEAYSTYNYVTKVLYPSDFGPTGEAVMTVKYTPEYIATEDFQELRIEVKAVGARQVEWEDEEEDDFFITDPSEVYYLDGVDREKYYTDEAYRKRVDEFRDKRQEAYQNYYDADPYALKLDEVPVNSEYYYFRREVKLGKPYASLVKVGAENPAPNPNPNPSPAPVNNSVVTSTASAAAVLGESREQVVEETPEEAAVLGEDRPQTGDMAMPALWLLVMIGCGAGAALVLRKKEK